MSWSLILTISMTMIVVGLLPSLSCVKAIIVNNTDFSVNVLNNWAYQQSKPFAEAFGGLWLDLIPTEFRNLLVDTSKNLTMEVAQNRGAYSIISLDSNYPFRNVPLEIYTEYNINLSPVKIFSKENTTIDGEPAVKIHRNARSNETNLEVVDYYVVHDSKAYTLQYVANVKDFQKYLQQFEQMVKTFKFAK